MLILLYTRLLLIILSKYSYYHSYYCFNRFYFWFDVLASVSGLICQESFKYYWLKIFRLIHINQIIIPFDHILRRHILKNFTKKRQNMLMGFVTLNLIILYICHVNACIWIYLGQEVNCWDLYPHFNLSKDKTFIGVHDESCHETKSCCTNSWRYTY